MAPKKKKTFRLFTHIIELTIITLSLFLNPASVKADGVGELSFPDFSTFIESVKSGDAGILRGVYVSDVMSFPVIQQPAGNPGFVSQDADVITQFSMASDVGNVGLLAHNHLAGQTFKNLEVGNEVRLVYGDGRVEYFIVNQLLEYQALQPYSPYSKFRDLETDQILNVEELFQKVYRGDRHVTFQVCIEANGIDAWGRLFVIAQPRPDPRNELDYLRRIAKYLTIQ